MRKVAIITIGLLATVAILLFDAMYGYSFNNNSDAYAVYVDGNNIGTVRSIEKFEEYITYETKRLNGESTVGVIYEPENYEYIQLEFIKGDFDISKEQEVYLEFTSSVKFLTDAYSVTVTEDIDNQVLTTEYGSNYDNTDIDSFEEVEDVTFYVSTKEVADVGFDNLLNTFAEIPETGIPTNISLSPGEQVTLEYYVKGNIVGEQVKVPYDEIIPDEEVFEYLLFSDNEETTKYVVKEGDTIDTIADDFLLNPKEFLIVNPQYSSVNDILAPGEVIEIRVPKPVINIFDVKRIMVESTIYFETTIIVDENRPVGDDDIILSEGETGLKIIEYEQNYVNGLQINEAEIINEVIVKPVQNRVIERGGLIIPDVGTGSWGNVIAYGVRTSGYGPRWGGFHSGLDMGAPVGTNVYAADNGVVVFTDRDYIPGVGYGIYTIVDHQNGYASLYAHLSVLDVDVGDIVAKGDVLGLSGNTGFSTGPHLHLEIIKYTDSYKNGVKINPETITNIFTQTD